ncbi:MAG: MarC family protein [Candidatus Aenigmatarchaeota archaeon]
MVLDIPTIIQSIILLFIIMDPLGNVPVYFSVTKTFKENQKNKIIQQAILTASFILIAFTVLGKKIFEYFNLSFESFLIAGGVLLFLIGLDMVRGHMKQYEHARNFGVVPLGIPLIAGPGAITMAIILSQTSGLTTAVISIIAAMVLMELTLAFCDSIMKFIGTKSSETLTRIMGIILAVVAVQFILNGLQSFF